MKSLLCTLLALGASAFAQTPAPFIGVTVGYDVDPVKAAPFLKEAGAQTCRLWAAVDYADREGVTIHGVDVFQQAREFKKLGFRVILLIQNPKPAPYEQVKAFYQWAASHRGASGKEMPLSEAVDAWEVINELNLEEYWTGSPENYVNDILRPAYEVLSAIREPVIGGSFTAWQKQSDGQGAWADQPARATVAKQYLDAGYLRYCDFAGLHPYTDSPERMVRVVDAYLSLVQGKPVILTEWNLKTWSDPAAQAEALTKVLPEMQQRVRGLCFYRLTRTKAYWGLLNLEKGQFSKLQPFFDTFQSWTR
jgi:hypothetical protein